MKGKKQSRETLFGRKMSNKRRVIVAIHHRDRFSLGEDRQRLQHGAFHWSILTAPKSSKGADNIAYDVSNGARESPDGSTAPNPNGEWFFRGKGNVDPQRSSHLIGRILIGKIPNDISDAQIKEKLRQVPLPDKAAIPEQNCVSWIWDAIRVLQDANIIGKFDMGRFAEWALTCADTCMSEMNPRIIRSYNG